MLGIRGEHGSYDRLASEKKYCISPERILKLMWTKELKR